MGISINTRRTDETFLGSACSGSDGDTARTKTLTTIPLNWASVFVNGLRKSTEISITGQVITFNMDIWDTDKIIIRG